VLQMSASQIWQGGGRRVIQQVNPLQSSRTLVQPQGKHVSLLFTSVNISNDQQRKAHQAWAHYVLRYRCADTQNRYASHLFVCVSHIFDYVSGASCWILVGALLLGYFCIPHYACAHVISSICPECLVQTVGICTQSFD
jgi:hypothetical protein